MDGYDPLLLSRRTGAAVRAAPEGTNLRGPEWVRPLHGVVRPAFVGHDPITTRIGDAVALMGPANVLGGWAALFAQGNHWFDGQNVHGAIRDVIVHCLPGSQLRVRTGVRPSEGLVHPDEHLDLGGYAAATLARAAYDEMCRARTINEAVLVADMATSTVSDVPHATPDAIRRVLASHHKVRGIVRAREALEFSTTRSASPAETRTRMIAVHDAGLKNLVVNQPVFDAGGRFLAVVDLLDEESGLAIETDGDHHLAREQLTADHRRQSRLELAGVTVLRITADDRRDRWGTVRRIREARLLASSKIRGWTIEPTAAWTTTPAGRRWA